MAQWKQALEPYIKVNERIRSSVITPVAGEDLIIGAVIISDAGPSTPTLITSQTEFLDTYSSGDITEDYMKNINKLYSGEDSSLASTVWLNAYRLAGSVEMLVVRAAKANGIYFAKALSKIDKSDYIIRDGNLLKKVAPFKVVVDVDKDSATHSSDGWAIAVNGIGVIGNRTNDSGAQYDYFVDNLSDLVDYLNDTSMFFSPDYKFYDTENQIEETTEESANPEKAKCVVFNEVYLGESFLDKSDSRCTDGLAYVVVCDPDWTIENPSQKLFDLDSMTNFDEPKYAAMNKFSTSMDLKVRIRRFNHDAVVSKSLAEDDANEKGNSPYRVLTDVLDTLVKSDGSVVDAVKERDFYEFAVEQKGEVLYFNVGNIEGRGDLTIDKLEENLDMISLQLPDDLSELGIDYYGYLPESKRTGWKELSKEATAKLTDTQKQGAVKFASESEMDSDKTSRNTGDYAVVGSSSSVVYVYKDNKWSVADHSDTVDSKGDDKTVAYEAENLNELSTIVKHPQAGDLAKVGIDKAGVYFVYSKITLDDAKPEQIYVNVKIDPEKSKMLLISDTDMVKALDGIANNEIYTVEGLADLGNTNPMYQNALANMAINDNYFYPISPANSTNYLVIANSISRISKVHHKLYVSAPWDVDTGTVGFRFYASPDVIYWEMVGRNRGLNAEFADTFGQTNGIAQYQDPVVEFNKKTRQLLLSRKINTVMWNTQTSAYNMNESVTKETNNDIMSNDANVRLQIRISKAMPILLRQFIGEQISETLWNNAKTVITNWFENTIRPLRYGIDAYQITIDESNNPVSIQRQNKMQVLVEVRYRRSLKYVIVYNDALDVGQSFTGEI